MKIIKRPTEDVFKATSDDIHSYLRDAIKLGWEFTDGWFYGVDYDNTYAYFTIEYYEKGYYDISYRVSYTLDGVNVTLGDELEEVKKETTFTLVQKIEESTVVKTLKNLFDQYFGKKDTQDTNEIPIIKQLNDEEQIAIEVMYAFPGEADGHNEGMSLNTIKEMVLSANTALDENRLSAGLFHKENTDSIEFLKIWVNECDCYIGSTFVPEGSALVKTKFHDDDLWEDRRSGKLGGLSIGAKCTGKTSNSTEE